MGVPIVTSKWLEDSVNEEKFLPVEDYLLPIFQDIKVGVLGFNSKELQEIKEIINVIKEYNPTDYLLIDFNSNKLTEIKLNQRINQIFNKKVGVNGLRHSHITELYADKPITNLNEVLTNAKNNKHSLKTHLQYIKN